MVHTNIVLPSTLRAFYVMFLNKNVLQHAKYPSWRTTLGWLFTTAYVRSQSPYLEAYFPIRNPRGRGVPWGKEPTEFSHILQLYPQRVYCDCVLLLDLRIRRSGIPVIFLLEGAQGKHTICHFIEYCGVLTCNKKNSRLGPDLNRGLQVRALVCFHLCHPYDSLGQVRNIFLFDPLQL